MKITKTNSITSKRISILAYGESGIGKTTLCSTLKGKTLLISAESGHLALKNFDIDMVELTGTAKEKLYMLHEVLETLKQETDFENIFIDSLTEIAQIFVEFFTEKYPDRKDALVMWGEYAKSITKFIKECRDLRPYNVVLVALEKCDTDEIGRRFKMPDLNGKIAKKCAAYFDEVFNYQIVSDGKTERRMLLTAPHDDYIAKDR